MCKYLNKKSLVAVTTMMFILLSSSVKAESLFMAGISQNVSPSTPRSLFSSIRATNVGDLVTIVVDESTSIQNTVSLTSDKKSSIEDEWTDIFNKIIPGEGVMPNIDGWGGASKVSNNATVKRSNSIKQRITTQVVQVLPNGNLVVQGRKQIVNSGERQDIVVSGIVNPRLVDSIGQVPSNSVANLQVAIVGKGTVSRVQSDGLMNKFLRIFF